MPVRRSTKIAVLSLLMLSMELAYAAPVRATAGAVASLCCAARCKHASSHDAARKCCKIVRGGADLAVVSQIKPQQPVSTAVVLAAASLARYNAPAPPVVGISDIGRARAVPLFLLTSSLRC